MKPPTCLTEGLVDGEGGDGDGGGASAVSSHLAHGGCEQV